MDTTEAPAANGAELSLEEQKSPLLADPAVKAYIDQAISEKLKEYGSTVEALVTRVAALEEELAKAGPKAPPKLSRPATARAPTNDNKPKLPPTPRQTKPPQTPRGAGKKPGGELAGKLPTAPATTKPSSTKKLPDAEGPGKKPSIKKTSMTGLRKPGDAKKAAE